MGGRRSVRGRLRHLDHERRDDVGNPIHHDGGGPPDGKPDRRGDQHTTYVKGDSFVLTCYLNLTATAAATEANRWFSIACSSCELESVADGLTVSSTIAELGMTAPITTTPPAAALGQSGFGVKGTTKASPSYPAMKAVLYVRVKAVPLPDEVKMTYKNTSSVASVNGQQEFLVGGQHFSK